MSDILISTARFADELLHALADQLSIRDRRYTLAVVGGSALLVLNLIARVTQDIDVVGLLENQTLVSAQPLPAPLLEAARVVARDFGLKADWLNPGPTSLLDLGLPAGFRERAQRRVYGPSLSVLFASRVDQIHLKLYATVDHGAGKHFEDLRALSPTTPELLDAARWSRTHDPSEGYLSELVSILAHFGLENLREGELDV